MRVALGRAAHGAARVEESPAEDSFFHVVELEAVNEYAAERRAHKASVFTVNRGHFYRVNTGAISISL